MRVPALLQNPRLAVAAALGAFALPALVLPCQAQSYRDGDQVFAQAFAAEPGGRLVVDLSSEDVVLEPADGASVRVAVFARGRNSTEAFERKRFSASQDGQTVYVKTDPDKRNGWRWNDDGARFTVVVQIPQPFDVALDLSSGDVATTTLRGTRFVLNSSSGDLSADRLAFEQVVFDASSGGFEVGEVEGALSIDVSSGDATIERVRGERLVYDASSGDLEVGWADVEQLVFDASSGDLAAGRVTGEVIAKTSSGDVELGTVGGRLVASTSSGSVEATLLKAAPVAVDTGSGSVTLRLARGLGAELSADGGSVRIDGEVGFAGSVEDGKARGRVGAGGPSVVVNTGSGSIRILAQ